MEFKLIDFIQHIANILVLFLLLRALLFKPVRKFMQQREEKFAREREAIKSDKEKALSLKQQYEAQLTAAQQKAEELAQERLHRAEEEAQLVVDQAKKDAQTALEKAHAQAIAERDEIMLDLKDETAALAVDLAGRILEREVSEKDNARIIEEYFQKVV